MIFGRKKENREMMTEENLDRSLRASIGVQSVDNSNVMEIPAVQSAVSFLSGTISELPVRLYKKTGGKTEEVTDDYRIKLLNSETGDTLDAVSWKNALVRDFVLYGNAYSVVRWTENNKISGIYYVKSQNVGISKQTEGVIEKTGSFCVGGEIIIPEYMFRVLRDTQDGFTGSGIIESNQQQLSLMLNSIKYENRMVKTGGMRGILTVMPGKKLAADALKALKRAWSEMFSSDGADSTVVLNDGVDYKETGKTAVETQLNENKRTNAHEIFKILGIVPSVIEGGATKDDVKNTVRFSIKPIVKAIESAINRFCLLESEKETLHFEIDLDELDTTDVLERYQAYQVGVASGFLQIDEIRNREGRNPLGLDFVKLGLDSVLYWPKTKKIYIPNTKQFGEISEEGGENIDESGIESEPGREEGS